MPERKPRGAVGPVHRSARNRCRLALPSSTDSRGPFIEDPHSRPSQDACTGLDPLLSSGYSLKGEHFLFARQVLAGGEASDRGGPAVAS